MLESRDLMLSLSSAARRPALAGLVALGSTLLYGHAAYSPQEGEYSLTRGRLGDQTHPSVSVGAEGGFVAWEDYSTDGNGLGVSARALNNSLSPVTAQTFRVNESTAGDQSAAVVQVLPGGGAMFAWQGGTAGQEDVFIRVVGADGLLATPEVRVNVHTAKAQTEPKLALLKDGNLVVVWTSLDQDGSMQGVFGRRITAAGAPLGDEFQVNTFTGYNQRSPSVGALDDGDFVVVWVSENQRYENSVDLLARRYNGDGTADSGEVLVTGSRTLSANPVITAAGDGRFVIAWSSESLSELKHGWDVIACAYDLAGNPIGGPVRLNQFTLGHQYGPRLAANGSTVLVTWTAEYQDGSRESVYGRWMNTEGVAVGDEFQVNTWTISRQIHPDVASDGAGRFVVAWSSYVGGDASFEVLAQRYAETEVLLQPAPPYVSALDPYTLLVSWPELAGYADAVSYRVYVDGAAEPMLATGLFLRLEDLTPASEHTFRLAYQTAEGSISPRSEPASGKTWGRDLNFDGLADDWQAQYWGTDGKQWAAAWEDSDGDGARNVDEFLAGTDPTDSASVLRVRLSVTPDGCLVQWEGTPGSLYQLQGSPELKAWADIEGPRLAVGAEIGVVVPFSSGAAYYRVIRIR